MQTRTTHPINQIQLRLPNGKVVSLAVALHVVHLDAAVERHRRVLLAVGKVQVEQPAILHDEVEPAQQFEI